MILDILERIQEWFKENCDGNWEHAQNILITTIDNPGWSVTINLYGTKLENMDFKTVDLTYDETNWFYCVVKNNQFQGDGGVRNLTDILYVFINWVEHCR